MPPAQMSPASSRRSAGASSRRTTTGSGSAGREMRKCGFLRTRRGVRIFLPGRGGPGRRGGRVRITHRTRGPPTGTCPASDENDVAAPPTTATTARDVELRARPLRSSGRLHGSGTDAQRDGHVHNNSARKSLALTTVVGIASVLSGGARCTMAHAACRGSRAVSSVLQWAAAAPSHSRDNMGTKLTAAGCSGVASSA